MGGEGDFEEGFAPGAQETREKIAEARAAAEKEKKVGIDVVRVEYRIPRKVEIG
jgi:hypothetical protein